MEYIMDVLLISHRALQADKQCEFWQQSSLLEAKWERQGRFRCKSIRCEVVNLSWERRRRDVEANNNMNFWWLMWLFSSHLYYWVWEHVIKCCFLSRKYLSQNSTLLYWSWIIPLVSKSNIALSGVVCKQDSVNSSIVWIFIPPTV